MAGRRHRVYISPSRSQALHANVGGVRVSRVKATRDPCPCLDSISWEGRRSTAQCGVCPKSRPPLRLEGFQFRVLVIKEGHPKCPPNPTWHSPIPPIPCFSLLPSLRASWKSVQTASISMLVNTVEKALECLGRLFFYEGIAWVWTADSSTNASTWWLYQLNLTAHSIWKGSVGLSFHLLKGNSLIN